MGLVLYFKWGFEMVWASAISLIGCGLTLFLIFDGTSASTLS